MEDTTADMKPRVGVKSRMKFKRRLQIETGREVNLGVIMDELEPGQDSGRGHGGPQGVGISSTVISQEAIHIEDRGPQVPEVVLQTTQDL